MQVLDDLDHWEWLWDLSMICLCEEQVVYMLSPICCSGNPGNDLTLIFFGGTFRRKCHSRAVPSQPFQAQTQHGNIQITL